MTTSRERPVIPMRRNFSEFRDQQVMPLYIVCDESEPMESNGGIAAINQALPDIHAAIASDPLVSDKFLIGLITFAETAEELMEISKLSDVVYIPGIQARGASKFGPVFALLRHVIERDVRDLKFYGADVFRPSMLFITNGEPTDDPAWENEYRSLMDKSTFRQYPNIIAFGVHGADGVTIGKIGTIGAFLGSDDVTPSSILSAFTNSFFCS